MRTTNALAIVAASAVLPLILLGSVVTTMKFGMVDSQGLRSPWHFLAELAQNNHNVAWVVEHGHRFAGWIVGILAIGVVLGALRSGRSGLIGLAALSLVAVIIQGCLGIFRIEMDALFGQNAAWIHGAFAAIVVALLITQAAATSRSWTIAAEPARSVRNLALWTLAILYVQVVTGGWIRHRDAVPGGRLHLMFAFVSFAITFQLIRAAWTTDPAGFKILCRVMMILMFVQVGLGVESFMGWMKRREAVFVGTGPGDSIALQITRSLHYVIGILLFSTVAVTTAKLIFAPRVAPPSATQEAAL